MPATAAHDTSESSWVIGGKHLAHASDQEWLLSNALGGYAMGSASGTPTRRYHALLTSATRPPVGRISCVSAIDDAIVLNVGSPEAERVHLTAFQFHEDDAPPTTPTTLVEFNRDATGVRWIHRINRRGLDITIEKSLHLYDRRNAARLKYAVRSAGTPVRLELRPLVRLMDHHELSLADRSNQDQVQTHEIDGGCVVLRGISGVLLASRDCLFVPSSLWWQGVRYQRDLERGQESLEDLFSPGVFEWTTVPAAGTTSVVLHMSCEATEEPSTLEDTAQSERRIAEHTRKAIVKAGGDALDRTVQRSIASLVRAADQFVVERRDGPTPGTSIIAGYPWFSDWGRDAMIAMPGLLLCSGRFDEARSLLETFASHRKNGLIPNRFEDVSGTAQFNTADASLLFIKAACEWAHEAKATLDGDILQTCYDIVDAYERGTDFSIRLDSDGLIAAGDESTQLTWMDAARDGQVFTPRFGKAIEINALWHHDLIALATLVEPTDRVRASKMREQATACRESINSTLWNEPGGCMFDRLEPRDGGWQPIDELRPNQLFAIALAHPPVTGERASRTLATVERELLTDAGMRTLAPSDENYRGRYEGSMPSRDAAYHNGTAWPWLLGPYADAVLRVHGRTHETIERVHASIDPLITSMTSRCLAQIGEVFDGDSTPDRPASEGGCVAQAWSVAEILRVLIEISRTA